MQTYYHFIKSLFAQNSNPEKAEPMKRYMRDQFEFFGIQATPRRELSRQIFREKGIPKTQADLIELCTLCWNDPHRELQYFIYDLLVKMAKKLEPSFLDFCESLILQKSWWDTVDFLAPKVAGGIFLRHPDEIRSYTEKWISSDNIWLQRSAIIFQLSYKEKTDATLLFQNINRRAESKEFFVQKGAGWALREYSKTDAQSVVNFLNTHTLAPLTKREALKWLNRR